jgi:group I intron endonuclease
MIVYLITNKVNGKQYVGQTTKTVEKRWEKHLENADLGIKFLIYKSIRKYGAENFSRVILHECETKEEMDFVEMFYIALLSTKAPNGHNLTDGGEGQFGRRLSEKAIQKMRDAFTGKPNPKNSEHLKKNPRPRNPVNGRLLSDNEIATGNWDTTPAKASEETRLKMSKAHEGFRHTEESKAKMRGKRGPRKR